MVDEEDGVSTLGTVPYNFRQPSNVFGESFRHGVFIESAYDLSLPLGFYCGGVKYSLEGNSALPYGFQYMVGLCA